MIQNKAQNSTTNLHGTIGIRYWRYRSSLIRSGEDVAVYVRVVEVPPCSNETLARPDGLKHTQANLH